ncbi:hypothetical protein V2J09_011237 [Rumex salicifolius]
MPPASCLPFWFPLENSITGDLVGPLYSSVQNSSDELADKVNLVLQLYLCNWSTSRKMIEILTFNYYLFESCLTSRAIKFSKEIAAPLSM